MAPENKRLLLIEDENTEDFFKALLRGVRDDVEILRSYTTTQDAVDLINREPLNAIVTGWKIRGPEVFSPQELVAPRVIIAAKEKGVPTIIYSSHPDAFKSQTGAKIVNKTKAEISDLRLMLQELLNERPS